jgi:hypothetical protein
MKRDITRPLTGGGRRVGAQGQEVQEGQQVRQVQIYPMLAMDKNFSLQDGEDALRQRYLTSLTNLQSDDFVDKADWLGDVKTEAIQHFDEHWVDQEGGNAYWPRAGAVLDTMQQGFLRAAWKGLGLPAKPGDPVPPPDTFADERAAGLEDEDLTGVLPRVTTWVPLSGYDGPVIVDAVRGVSAVQVVVFTAEKPADPQPT